ncbi:potassium-transporting ATPase subunit KdpC [Anaeromyxobacter sp. PSR-1]|uniref:potassium-transporting ATPase subunit KdpC n=1 Tax=unclassified Anaeromyxobacter TaxID=2620896 RepID=UPI0005E962DC|nr:potassium-transporting ATPase subunit KdpC [Anaeromyxobacter sp. PSR-1]GAO03801.1 potassium-transporting ATPase C chain [Anaeromyxobacter sp. PSR-1]
MIRPALVLLAAFTLLTGLAYPALLTATAQLAFPAQANGSVLARDGAPVGSALVGQPLSDARYFWGRPSATAPGPYDGRASGASNLGPSNPALVAAVRDRIAVLRASDPGNPAPVPVDLVTASASGLDPHLSPAAALYQVRRVAKARGMPAAEVRALVERHVEPPLLGIFGAPRVNVLALDLALDDLCGRGIDAGRTGARRPHP